MHPKIIIIGFPALQKIALNITKTSEIFKDIIVEIENYDRFLDNIRNMEFAKNELTCNSALIATDRCALFLRENYNIPIIPVQFSGYALMDATKRAQKYLSNENDEVVLMNYYKSMDMVEKYRDQLKVKIRQVTFRNHEEANALLNDLAKKGNKVIIGGSRTSDIAQKYGLKGIFMYTHSSVKEALHYAAEIIQATRNEAEKTKRLKTIIDLMHNGIICTDNNLQITTFNKAAERILNISADKAVNNPITKIFPSIDLPREPHQLTTQTSSLVCHKNQTNLILDIIPIIVNDDNFTGSVFVIQDALTIQKKEQEIRRQLHQRRLVANYTFANIVGESPAIQLAVSKAKSFSQDDFTILITGETGTGKELFAQSIHNISSRSQKPFVAINCSALTESLLDSELFGYEQGAFTGARKEGKPGLFELAHTGTIFLDEVGELTPSTQTRLLRVIQEKEIMRIGGRKIIPVDVRIIAATNRNLLREVKHGNFRQDLYYRLSVLELHIPPLRERKEDIPHLARSILRKYMYVVDDSLINKIQSLANNYHWPGNIRELENILQRFSVLSRNELNKNKEELLCNIFWDHIKGKEIDLPKTESPQLTLSQLPVIELGNEVKKIEHNKIIQILKEVNGNKTAAARILGISRSTLWRKLNQK